MLAPYRWSLLPDATCLGQSGPGDSQWVNSMWLTAMGGRCHCKAVHKKKKKNFLLSSAQEEKQDSSQVRPTRPRAGSRYRDSTGCNLPLKSLQSH